MAAVTVLVGLERIMVLIFMSCLEAGIIVSMTGSTGGGLAERMRGGVAVTIGAYTQLAVVISIVVAVRTIRVREKDDVGRGTADMACSRTVGYIVNRVMILDLMTICSV